MWNELWLATIKAIPTLTVAVATLMLGWLVGNGIASRWEEVRKRRALELEALGRFYELYGEFYAVWKQWTIYKKSSVYLTEYERDNATAWKLLERAADVEGGFESLLVRLTQEHKLTCRDLQKLARFREGYQCLRESIRRDSTLDWKANPRHGESAKKYQQFKELAAHVAWLLSKTEDRVVLQPSRPTADEATEALGRATSVAHRGSWWKEDGEAELLNQNIKDSVGGGGGPASAQPR